MSEYALTVSETAVPELAVAETGTESVGAFATAGPSAVVSVDDALAMDAQDVTIGIEPVQDLHGYENPWPAGGGKNLFNIGALVAYNEEVSLTTTADSFTVVNSNPYSAYMMYGADGAITYAVTDGDYTISIAEAIEQPIAVYASSDGDSYSWYANGIVAGNTSATFTASGITRVRFVLYCPGNGGTITVKKFQFERGSTATAYAPYSNVCPITGHTGATLTVYQDDPEDATTYPIDWTDAAGTVYGGTLDVTTGVLTVDRAIVEYDGSSDEQWGEYTDARGNYTCICFPIDKALGYQKSICNEFENVNNAFARSDYGKYSDHPSFTNTYFRMPNANVETKSEFLAWIAQYPIQLVYELATPITYQLTPQQVALLLGENNLFADTGDTTLQYYPTGTVTTIPVTADLSVEVSA